MRDKLEGCRKSAGAPLREASKQANSDRGRLGMLRPNGIREDPIGRSHFGATKVPARERDESEDRESAKVALCRE